MSEAAALGLHAVICLAADNGRRMSAARIAERLDVSAAHLSKVMQRLVRGGVVRSTRGPRGGFTLGRPPGRISLLEVYEAIEGPFTRIDCLLNRPICDKDKCEMVDLASRLDEQVRTYFADTTVEDLAETFGSSRPA